MTYVDTLPRVESVFYCTFVNQHSLISSLERPVEQALEREKEREALYRDLMHSQARAREAESRLERQVRAPRRAAFLGPQRGQRQCTPLYSAGTQD